MKEKELFKILTHNVSETESAGALLAVNVKNNDFIALHGELGAGKTAFVRGFASAAAPGADVSSPSYGVVNEYDGTKFKICHFDMYRITSDDDLYSVGFYDYDNCVMLVEWCEKTPQILPKQYYRVKIDKVDEDTRMVHVSLITR